MAGRGRPANPDRVPTEQETIKRNLENGAYSDSNENDTLGTVIENATGLLEQKAAILSQIQECRVLGTLLVNQGIGSEAQRMWVTAYLPRKARATEDESGAVDTDDEDTATE